MSCASRFSMSCVSVSQMPVEARSAGISAFAQLLLSEKRFPPDQRTAAEMIYAEARRASSSAELACAAA